MKKVIHEGAGGFKYEIDVDDKGNVSGIKILEGSVDGQDFAGHTVKNGGKAWEAIKSEYTASMSKPKASGSAASTATEEPKKEEEAPANVGTRPEDGFGQTSSSAPEPRLMTSANDRFGGLRRYLSAAGDVGSAMLRPAANLAEGAKGAIEAMVDVGVSSGAVDKKTIPGEAGQGTAVLDYIVDTMSNSEAANLLKSIGGDSSYETSKSERFSSIKTGPESKEELKLQVVNLSDEDKKAILEFIEPEQKAEPSKMSEETRQKAIAALKAGVARMQGMSRGIRAKAPPNVGVSPYDEK